MVWISKSTRDSPLFVKWTGLWGFIWCVSDKNGKIAWNILFYLLLVGLTYAPGETVCYLWMSMRRLWDNCSFSELFRLLRRNVLFFVTEYRGRGLPWKWEWLDRFEQVIVLACLENNFAISLEKCAVKQSTNNEILEHGKSTFWDENGKRNFRTIILTK